MIIRVKIGHRGFLFDEPVWEKVLEESNIKNVLIECEDDHGNIINTLQFHDPDEAVEEDSSV